MRWSLTIQTVPSAGGWIQILWLKSYESEQPLHLHEYYKPRSVPPNSTHLERQCPVSIGHRCIKLSLANLIFNAFSSACASPAMQPTSHKQPLINQLTRRSLRATQVPISCSHVFLQFGYFCNFELFLSPSPWHNTIHVNLHRMVTQVTLCQMKDIQAVTRDLNLTRLTKSRMIFKSTQNCLCEVDGRQAFPESHNHFCCFHHHGDLAKYNDQETRSAARCLKLPDLSRYGGQ